ncbi:MAG: DNA-3-methyladenine glycosylase I [Chloroflexi bacterium]|nr:DNA-3-methyladenine glycosylase I [Chloroflexota bacterium]
MEAPPQITPKSVNDYLEVMTKAVFQSGMSWKVVEAKWPGFREAFDGFDAHKIATLTTPDVDRLAQDTRIIRIRRKIEATIENAARMIDAEREFGSFGKYLESLPNFDAAVADITKRFKFMGQAGVYFLLWTVGRPVPSHDDWMAARPR